MTTTTTRAYTSSVQAGGIPTEGQVVYLAAAASVQFASYPIRLQLTRDAEPSFVDASRGRKATEAEWLYLTGWELDGKGRRALERTVSACVRGIVIVNGSNALR